jgi:hypothetical protein
MNRLHPLNNKSDVLRDERNPTNICHYQGSDYSSQFSENVERQVLSFHVL